jgi:hypothetical protein
MILNTANCRISPGLATRSLRQPEITLTFSHITRTFLNFFFLICGCFSFAAKRRDRVHFLRRRIHPLPLCDWVRSHKGGWLVLTSIFNQWRRCMLFVSPGTWSFAAEGAAGAVNCLKSAPSIAPETVNSCRVTLICTNILIAHRICFVKTGRLKVCRPLKILRLHS